MLEVRFRTNRLQRCYEQSDRAIREWGDDVGRRYVARVTTLHTLQHFQEIYGFAAWRAHPLKGSRSHETAITITAQWRLIVVQGETDAVIIVEEVSNHYD